MAESSQMPSESSKRTSVESFRRPSLENLKRASQDSNRRCSSTKQENSLEDAADDTEKGELPDSYIQSKFNRKGSQYRNAGWKSHNKLERNDSTSSVKSSTSEKLSVGNASSVGQTLPHMSSSEQQAYISQKFSDITNILKDSGVDEDILQMIKD